MTNEQFKEIKDRAWDWYRGNMLEWAINTLKDITNAPEWVKNCLADDWVVCPSMDDEIFELAHKEDIETILRLSQTRHFEINYTREMEEYYQAKLDGNIEAMVGEICDLILVSLNAGIDQENPAIGPMEYLSESSVIDSFYTGNIDPLLEHILYLGYDPYLCLYEKLKELESRDGKWDEERGKWCKFIGAYSLKEAQKIIKEMTSTPIKFVEEKERYWGFKFDTESHFDYTKITKWYKADFSKCNVGGENA